MSWAACPLLLVPELLPTAGKNEKSGDVPYEKDVKRLTLKDRRRKTNLSDFFDLTATLADERAALAGRHNEAHGDWRFAGGRAVRHGGADVLQEIWRTSDKFYVKIYCSKK